MLKEKDAVIRRALFLLDAFLVSMAFILAFVIRRNIHYFYKLDLIPSTHVIAEMNIPFSDFL